MAAFIVRGILRSAGRDRCTRKQALVAAGILGVDRVLLLYDSLDEALAGPAAPPVRGPAASTR